jgi:maleamate amidohydrolase
VLVVDLVRAYLDDGSPLQMDTAAAARDATSRLVEAARAAGVPVIWTAVRYAVDGSDGGRFFQKVPSLAVFADGAGDLGDFPAEVSPADGETVVVKQYPSAFFGTDLADDLHAQGIDTLLIAGYSTSGCVRASALDALCHGFVPLVVREACADRDPRPHTSAVRPAGQVRRGDRRAHRPARPDRLSRAGAARRRRPGGRQLTYSVGGRGAACSRAPGPA